MPSKMCKDQTNVAVFSHETQNASHNEIHTDHCVSFISFICIYTAARGASGGVLVLTWGILVSLHACACPSAEPAALSSSRLGSSWGTITYSDLGNAATLKQGACLSPELLC